MRRGYSRDTYLALIDRVRELLPGIWASRDTRQLEHHKGYARHLFRTALSTPKLKDAR